MAGVPIDTIRDLIYYRSAELIARDALDAADLGGGAWDHAGHVRQIFGDLRTGRWRWPDALEVEPCADDEPRICAFCGSDKDVTWLYLVPTSMAVHERCGECAAVRAPHNRVPACLTFRTLKADNGLYNALKILFPENPQFYDAIPRWVEKAYLRGIYECHECAGTLESGDLDGDGELTLLDVDQVITAHAARAASIAGDGRRDAAGTNLADGRPPPPPAPLWPRETSGAQ